MNCPNINIKEVRNEFNSIVEAFGGRPLTIDEFKSKDLRNKRAGVDDNAMQVAYFLWDKTNGDGLAALPEYVNSNISDEYTRIRAVVNKLLGVDREQTTARQPRSNIREDVAELFESNPELANAVYEALGFNTIDENDITYTDEEGNLCAKMGLTNTVKGSDWKIVKDFKGQPKHSQGGVDIAISDKGVTMRRGGKDIKAQYGLLIPNNN